MHFNLHTNVPFNLENLNYEQIRISKIISWDKYDLNILIFIESNPPDSKYSSYHIHPLTDYNRGENDPATVMYLQDVILSCKYTTLTIKSIEDHEVKIEYEPVRENDENTGGKTVDPGRVRILYSGGNKTYTSLVLKLARRFLNANIGVVMDRHDSPSKRRNKIDGGSTCVPSDVDLVVLNPEMTRQFTDPNTVKKIKVPKLNKQLNDSINGFKEFMPVIRESSKTSEILIFLNTARSVVMTDNKSYKEVFDVMVREISNYNIPVGIPLDFNPLPKNECSTPVNVYESATNSGLSNYAKWNFVIDLKSLIDKEALVLKELLNKYCIKDKNDRVFPKILNPDYQSSSDENLYMNPLSTSVPTGICSEEALRINKGQVIYEFAQYSDCEKIALNLKTPLLSLIFLLSDLRKIHKKLKRKINLTLKVNFTSNRQSIALKEHAPFDFGDRIEHYFVKDNSITIKEKFSKLDMNKLYYFTDLLYGRFISTNRLSREPYLSVRKQHFESLVGKYFC